LLELLVLAVKILLNWGRHRCDLSDSFELQEILLNIGVEEERGLYMADSS
jgi:hypothetical protein